MVILKILKKDYCLNIITLTFQIQVIYSIYFNFLNEIHMMISKFFVFNGILKQFIF